MKKCFKCGEIKDITLFYHHPRMADGHLNKCIECTKKDTHKRAIEKSEYIKQYEISRNKTDKRKKQIKKHCKEWRAKNPEKYRAHCFVNNAIRSGEIKKADVCQKCGAKVKLHAHHFNYLEPLTVIWLCPSCHINLHLEATCLHL